MMTKATTKTESVEVEELTDDGKKKRVRHSYLYAVGRRKTSVARVRLFKKGEGKILVNGKALNEYFPTLELRNIAKAPLETINRLKEFDFSVKVAGGGMHGQAEAMRHGVARALLVFDKDLRTILKPEGFLKRDARRKERKKPGLKRARRAPQWSKR